MANYNQLIIDLEAALRTQQQLNAGYRDQIASLKVALSLEKTLSAQRNRIIGEMGQEIESLTVERDNLFELCTALSSSDNA